MQHKKILIIGSGGIGCELLKLLYLYQENDITIIDFDTIELTNLNRQFLFSDTDIKKYKSIISAEKFRKMNNQSKIIAITESIFNYDIQFFKQFDIVFNCLDNNEARSFVNKRCFINKTFLIDGGSTGWLGQSLYFSMRTECFDCIPKRIQETIPVCTIRSKPTDFNHCLIWSKEYFLEKYKEERVNILELLQQEYGSSTQKIDSLNKEILHLIEERDDIIFDKEDELIMKFIYELSVFRARHFNIEIKTYFESQSVIGNIIPSICTTNSIVASLMLMSYNQKSNYFISSTRRFLKIECADRNTDCTFCKFRMFIFYRPGILKVKDVLKYFGSQVGEIETIYYEGCIYYQRLMTDKNHTFNVLHNEFFYLKGKETVLVYNFIRKEEELELVLID